MRVLGNILTFGLICLVLAVAFYAFSTGPGRTEARGAAPIAEGSLQFQGRQRTYSICLPAQMDQSKRYPIVMFLHGGFGSGSRLAQSTGLCDHVNSRRFIAVLPNAAGKQWNDGRETVATGVDDVGFLRALVKHVAAQHGGDAGRAFVAGPSNGGNMTLRMACEATETFKAYGVVAANLPANMASRCPARPVAILFIQSKDDPATPWGGRDQAAPAVARGFAAGGRLMSAPDTVSYFARINGCSGKNVRDLPDRVDDGTTVRLHTYTGCKPGAETIQYELNGAGHGWPGARGRRGPRMAQMFGVVSQEINATEVLLDFFSRHGL